MPGQAASRYATASWFKTLGRNTALNISANQNLADLSQRSVYVMLSWALDARTSVSVGVERSDQGTTFSAQASQPPPSEGGLGWSAALRQGGSQSGAAGELNHLGRYGRVAAGVNNFGGSRYAWGNATGGLVFMGGRPFAARRIDDAFAVVSTDGVPGVPVTLENRPMGVTDSHGMLLLTPLRAYQNNQLAIDPMNLPADVRVERAKALITPTDRAGTLVRFGITPIRAASVLLVDAAGQPLPLGSSVRANGQSAEVPVGYDGAVYLDTLDAHNVLAVQTPQGACTARFDYHAGSDGIVQVGPLHCVKENSRP